MRGELPAALALALLAAVAGGCVPSETDVEPASESRALERAEYERRLAVASGGPVSVESILARAEEAARTIESRMDRLAVELGHDGGWRAAFAELRREAPADETALLAAYREELARAEAFVRERDLVGLPPTRPEVTVLANPTLRAHFPLGLYHGGSFAVTTAGDGDGDDPAYLENHCRVCIPPLAVHEGYPGHHVAFSRMQTEGEGGPSLAELALYKPFVEGWGLYAEVLMLEQGYYDEPARELGAWRMLLLRALRAEVDARLHGGGLEPTEAGALYRQRLLLSPDAAAAEVRTHLAKPTVKASYFVGLLQLLELRRRARERHPALGLRELHDRLLGPPASLPGIAAERFGVELGPTGEAVPDWPRTDPAGTRG